MANTLSNLIPDVYEALDVVSRELVGAIPGVNRNAKADRLATGQTLRSSVVPVNTTATYTPAMSVPAAIDQTVGNVELSLSKTSTQFFLDGEEEYGVDQAPVRCPSSKTKSPRLFGFWS